MPSAPVRALFIRTVAIAIAAMMTTAAIATHSSVVNPASLFSSSRTFPTRASAQPRQVGLFVFGDNGNDVDVGARAEPDLGNSNGYNVVSWREGDIVYQLVTDLEEDDIRDLLPANPGRAPLPTVRPAPRPALEAQPASFQR